jgi:hypothetical protein
VSLASSHAGAWEDAGEILVPNRYLRALSLADFSQSLIKPSCIQVKRLAAFDTWELNRTQYKVLVVIVADNA